jgi:hypothetical protein
MISAGLEDESHPISAYIGTRVDLTEKFEDGLFAELKATLAQSVITQTQEISSYKEALESLEQAEKNKQIAEDRASKAEQELVLLKKKCHLVNDDREDSIEALRICLEDLTKMAGHCHDQFSDLLPPQSF